MNTICVFEDEQFQKLLPLVFTRPVFSLRCGMTSLFEKIQKQYPRKTIDLICRQYLVDSVKTRYTTLMVGRLTQATTTLFINGRILMNAGLAKKIKPEGRDEMFVCEGEVAAVRLNKQMLDLVRNQVKEVITKEIWDMLRSKVVVTEIKADLINYPWDLIHLNGREIVEDFKVFVGKRGKISGRIYEGAHLLEKSNIHVSESARIYPGAVINAEAGPVIIGDNVKIFPNAVIIGPAFVGNDSTIKAGAKIYENTSLGEMCKVGGEVEGTIIHSYSNKQHDGFLGHSYIGKWVNLGADTNNSDLKNNYGSVKVCINGEMIDSQQMFVGLIMGDHSKTGINTMFNTGTVVGVSANIFGEGFPPKLIPSFAWGGARGLVEYDLEKAKAVARRVYLRRKIEFGRIDEILLDKIFELTLSERAKADLRKGIHG